MRGWFDIATELQQDLQDKAESFSELLQTEIFFKKVLTFMLKSFILIVRRRYLDMSIKKQIKEQFHIVRASIRSIENSRCKNDIRKNVALLQVWNRTFDWLMEHAETNYDRNIARAYYGMLSHRMCEELTFEQFVKLANEIMGGTL